jgi:hypothetical protein
MPDPAFTGCFGKTAEVSGAGAVKQQVFITRAGNNISAGNFLRRIKRSWKEPPACLRKRELLPVSRGMALSRQSRVVTFARCREIFIGHRIPVGERFNRASTIGKDPRTSASRERKRSEIEDRPESIEGSVRFCHTNGSLVATNHQSIRECRIVYNLDAPAPQMETR